MGQKFRETCVNVFDVRRDDGACRAGLARETGARGWIVRVEMQDAPARGKVGRRLVGEIIESPVPVPCDRALARRRGDEDEGGLRARALDAFGELDVDAFVPECL